MEGASSRSTSVGEYNQCQETYEIREPRLQCRQQYKQIGGAGEEAPRVDQSQLSGATSADGVVREEAEASSKWLIHKPRENSARWRIYINAIGLMCVRSFARFAGGIDGVDPESRWRAGGNAAALFSLQCVARHSVTRGRFPGAAQSSNTRYVQRRAWRASERHLRGFISELRLRALSIREIPTVSVMGGQRCVQVRNAPDATITTARSLRQATT
jgi:hypothetical protein